MASKKKPAPKTPRPRAPIGWRFEQALAKARRGFVVQTGEGERAVQMRIHRGKVQLRDMATTKRWWGWGTIEAVYNDELNATWYVVPVRSSKGAR